MPKTDSQKLSDEYKYRRSLMQWLTNRADEFEQAGKDAADRSDWIEAHAAYAQAITVQQVWNEAVARTDKARRESRDRQERLSRRMDEARGHLRVDGEADLD